MSGAAWLKPLRHPRLWLALWWLALLAVVAVCLVPATDLPRTPPGGDKVEHFLAYFLLMASAVQVFAGRRALCLAAAGLVAMGVAIEFAQAGLTATRGGDVWDAVADLLGVLAGWALVRTPLRDLLLHLERRIAPGA
ncbi:VanZ family protein [Luteimonas aquatica]|uniref:VanZ family protein n=1 Tax=Luteimonas aquatica TaxID=450364 RepID=UPI001F588622|nr:VanZ family protein [Luteimonas aquatica]